MRSAVERKEFAVVIGEKFVTFVGRGGKALCGLRPLLAVRCGVR